jgi:hypothetical protein
MFSMGKRTNDNDAAVMQWLGISDLFAEPAE